MITIEQSQYDKMVAESQRNLAESQRNLAEIVRLKKEANGYIYSMNKSLLSYTKLDPPPISFSKLLPSYLLVWDCFLGSSKLEESNPEQMTDIISSGKNLKIYSGESLDQSG